MKYDNLDIKKVLFIIIGFALLLGIVLSICLPPYDEIRLTKWNFPILWIFETKGHVTCTPAVYDENLYFISWDGYLYSVSKKTGRLKWKKGLFSKIFKIFTDNMNQSSPIADEGRIYVGTYGGNWWWKNYMYCFEAKSNKLIWRKEFYAIRYDNAIVKERFYLASYRQGLFCLNKNDGQIIWRVNLRDPINTTPVINEEKLFISSDKSMYAISAENGKILWKYNTNGLIFPFKPLVENGSILFGSADQYFYIIDSVTGKLIKKIPGDSRIDSSPSTDGRFVVFCSHKTVYCLDLINLNIIWKNTKYRTNDVHPMIFKDYVILTGAIIDRKICLVLLNKYNGEEKYKANVLKSTGSRPLISNETLYYGSTRATYSPYTPGGLVAIDLKGIVESLSLY